MGWFYCPLVCGCDVHGHGCNALFRTWNSALSPLSVLATRLKTPMEGMSISKMIGKWSIRVWNWINNWKEPSVVRRVRVLNHSLLLWLQGDYTCHWNKFPFSYRIWQADFLGKTVSVVCISEQSFLPGYDSDLGISFMHINKYKHMLECFSPSVQVDINQNSFQIKISTCTWTQRWECIPFCAIL